MKKYNTNAVAEDLLGMRSSGSPIDLPWELGYVCPICGRGDEVNLDWSEYNGFLYCHECDLDIPSCLCLKIHDKESVEKSIDIFLDIVKDVKCRMKEEMILKIGKALK